MDFVNEDLLENIERYARGTTNTQKEYIRWRKRIIVFTAVVAGLNVLAASFDSITVSTSLGWFGLFAGAILEAFPWFVALSATVLACLVNLENFYAYSQKSNNYREAREMYLNLYRTTRLNWTNHVIPYGNTSFACENAIRVHEQLLSSELEIRTAVKDLVLIKGGGV